MVSLTSLMLQIIKKYLFPDRLAHFAAQQQLTAAMRKAHHNTAMDTFSQGANLKSQNSPIAMAQSMNANPATFGMQMPSLKTLGLAALMALLGLGMPSCQKDDDVTIENPILTGDLKNFVNPDLSTWSIQDDGQIDSQGNTVCTLSAPLANQSVALGDSPRFAIDLNVHDGSVGASRLAETVYGKNLRIEGGIFKVDIPGPFPQGSVARIESGTFKLEGKENDLSEITVPVGALGSVKPIQASLHYKGLRLTKPEHTPITIMDGGIDLNAISEAEKFPVDYSLYNTEADKIVATKAALKDYMTSQGYNMSPGTEHDGYLQLIDQPEFRALANNDLKLLTGYYNMFEGHFPDAERDFRYLTQYGSDGQRLPEGHPDENKFKKPIRLNAISNAQQFSGALRVVQGADGPYFVIDVNMYGNSRFDDAAIGSMADHIRHEMTHGDHPSSKSEEELAFMLAALRYVNRFFEPTTYVHYRLGEKIVSAIASSGQNGGIGASNNTRVMKTNGDYAYLGGNVNDGNVSARQRVASKYPDLPESGGKLNELTARKMADLAGVPVAELPIQVGEPLSYQKLDEFYKMIKIDWNSLTRWFDYYGLQPTVTLD